MHRKALVSAALPSVLCALALSTVQAQAKNTANEALVDIIKVKQPQSDWLEFRLQIGPNDFMVPQVFDPKDARWREGKGNGNGLPALCRGKS